MKRASERKAVGKSLCLKFSLFDSEGGRHIFYDGYCIDISETGISLITDCYFSQGHIIELLIPSEYRHIYRATKQAYAEVIWSRPENNGMYRNGLKFIAGNPSS